MLRYWSISAQSPKHLRHGKSCKCHACYMLHDWSYKYTLYVERSLPEVILNLESKWTEWEWAGGEGRRGEEEGKGGKGEGREGEAVNISPLYCLWVSQALSARAVLKILLCVNETLGKADYCGHRVHRPYCLLMWGRFLGAAPHKWQTYSQNNIRKG